MRKLLAALPAAALLAIVAPGCGDTCSSKPTDVRRTNQSTSCDVGTQTFTVNVTPACQSCVDSSPTCAFDVQGSQALLDVTVKECDANKGCGTASCSFGAVTCNYTASAASGTVTLLYNAPGAPGTQFTVNVGVSGANSTCTL